MPLFETQCPYVEATLAHFVSWTQDQAGTDEGPFSEYPRSEYWAYADYKYIAMLFQHQPSMFEVICTHYRISECFLVKKPWWNPTHILALKITQVLYIDWWCKSYSSLLWVFNEHQTDSGQANLLFNLAGIIAFIVTLSAWWNLWNWNLGCVMKEVWQLKAIPGCINELY